MNETQNQEVLELWQEDIVQEYYTNNAKKLYQMVDKILLKYGGITDHDEFYVLATDLFLLCINKFDRNKGNFGGLFYSILSKKIITAIRDKNRAIRSNTKRIIGEDGKVSYKFNQDISIATPIGDGDSILEDIIEDDKIHEELSNNVENYLGSLSETQKKIADMVIKKYSLQEIREELNISEVKFTKILLGMKSFDKEIILKHSDVIVEEDKTLNNSNTQTLEKSKPDRLSISSLIKKINNQTIRFNHPLQRPSDQWTSVMKGNLISDILQGNPIPPLVFAEEVINGLAIIWDLDGKQRATNCYSFKNDGFKVAKNIRRWNIVYQATIKDENGKTILDDKGFPQSERREFDIRGKKFSKLPEELRDKFLDYNFEITQYINCSKEDIAYHIARYNEGKPMSTSHKGIVRLGEEFASTIKSISAMPFFREKGGYKVSEGNNGTVDRVVVESIMAANFLDDWKRDVNEMCEFMKNNATSETFDDFETMVERISKVDNEDVLSMFDSKDSFVYFGLYARFVDTGLEDGKFVEFMTELARSLHSKEVNGTTYDDLCFDKETGKARSTKDKYIVIPKLELLKTLMIDFLHINIEETQSEVQSTLDFARENVGQVNNRNIEQEDINFYEEMLNDLSLEINNDTRLLEDKNKPSLLAITAYSCQKDIDLDNWFIDFFNRNDNFIHNQKENYIKMRDDLEKYILQKEKVSV